MDGGHLEVGRYSWVSCDFVEILCIVGNDKAGTVVVLVFVIARILDAVIVFKRRERVCLGLALHNCMTNRRGDGRMDGE